MGRHTHSDAVINNRAWKAVIFIQIVKKNYCRGVGLVYSVKKIIFLYNTAKFTADIGRIPRNQLPWSI